MLPAVVLVAVLCQLAVTLRWRRLRVWLVILTIVGGAAAAAMLWEGRRTMEDGLRYSWEGGTLPAVWLTGIVLLIV